MQTLVNWSHDLSQVMIIRPSEEVHSSLVEGISLILHGLLPLKVQGCGVIGRTKVAEGL